MARKAEGLATWVPQGKTVYVLRCARRGRALCEVDGGRALVPRSELRMWRAVAESPAPPPSLLMRPFDSDDLEACAAGRLR